MLFEYRCRLCAAASPPVTRRAAEAYRQEHRDVEHGGLIPQGEAIVRMSGSTPNPDGRYVSTGAVVALLVLLALASAVARLSGH